MSTGLGTYAYFWQWHPSAASPLSLEAMLERTADAGVDRFQICDYPELERWDAARLDAVRVTAEGLGVALELGTRGIGGLHLTRYLHLAERLGVSLVRSMLNAGDHRPTRDEAVRLLTAAVPAYAAGGVTLALETYEQVPVATLVDVVEVVGSPALGICLDPANCVAALELPMDTVRRTAAHVKNLHVKDFHFTRQDGWVGFSLVGCPLGEGLLPYAEMVALVDPDARGISRIVEHWLPWQGDSATTIALEQRWTEHNLSYLRSTQS
ncbi:Sugar phosphate isomerase/epimerase [Friedmanniella luteola]|uniref:Sugar phosphate isomerase/epimerase n=1 Tax=Friedmanniella luteola TaxID=546871 RepID=A0A1H1ZEE9_9ACTN|nr:TIM barrel protein [Friedmanniella luteola]SDT32088.1 Sugar phosphate isomerase/epimerase [Friedmanniella luteola]